MGIGESLLYISVYEASPIEVCGNTYRRTELGQEPHGTMKLHLLDTIFLLRP